MSTFVYSWKETPGNAASITIPWGDRRPYRGNTLLACILVQNRGNPQATPELQDPAGWKHVKTVVGDFTFAVYQRKATGNEPDAGYTWTWVDNTVERPIGIIVEIDRASNSDAIKLYLDNIDNVEGSSATQDVGSIPEETLGRVLVVGLAGEGDGWNPDNIQHPEDFEIIDGVADVQGGNDGAIVFAQMNANEFAPIDPQWSSLEAAQGATYGFSIVYEDPDTALVPVATSAKRKVGTIRRDVGFSLQVITPPANPLFTLDEMRAWLRLDLCPGETEHEDDALLTLICNSVVSELDGVTGWLGRALQAQSIRMLLDDFPQGAKPIALPLTSEQITGGNPLVVIRYVATDGTVTDFPEVGVIATNDPVLVAPQYGYCWPATRTQPRAVEVVYAAGYVVIPEMVKTYAKLRAGQLYEHRELVLAGTTIQPVPFLVNMLDNIRAQWFDPREQG